MLSLIVIICFLGIVPNLSKPIKLRNHSPMDVLFMAWPEARYPLELPFHRVDCFSEMERRHIVPQVITYRLENIKKLRNGICLVRIPTRSRVTVTQMNTNNVKSYVKFIAGSTQLSMPLHTDHIHSGQHENFGPWHMPCRYAYIVFRSRSDQLEWVEFRLEPELKVDSADDQRNDCALEEHNFAESLLKH
ncbi:hypothetical protein niasHT_033340 [Heterodera trifolii]|uniref:Effector protein n=1 Tax=Heterodera trifolii TaxID=157864 RepID=A0ABD2I837_9BILA